MLGMARRPTDREWEWTDNPFQKWPLGIRREREMVPAKSILVTAKGDTSDEAKTT